MKWGEAELAGGVENEGTEEDRRAVREENRYGR